MFGCKNKSPLIGLDLAADAARLIQLSSAGDAVAAAARVAAGADADGSFQITKGSIRAALYRFGFKGRRIVAALPESLVQVRNMRIPEAQPEKLAETVQAEARSVLTKDFAEGQLHFLTAGLVRQGGETKQEIIVVAAARSRVDDFVETLHREHLEVVSLEFAPCALQRALRHAEPAAAANVAVVVEIGASFTRVVITRDGQICLVKTIQLGAIHLQQALGRKLGISPEEAVRLRRRMSATASATEIARNRRDPIRQAVFDATRALMQQLAAEVTQCTRYYTVSFRGQPPESIHLTGHDADDAELAHMLQSVSGIPVRAMRTLGRIDSSPMSAILRHGPAGEWSVAFGLAAKEHNPPIIPATPVQAQPESEARPAEQTADPSPEEPVREAAVCLN